MSSLDRSGRLGVHGAKARIRYIAPRPHGRGWYWGWNFEVGRVDRHIEAHPWGAELRGILGVDQGRWSFAVNPTLEWTFSGRDPEPIEVELQSKLAYRVRKDLAFGLESYDALRGENEHVLYATADWQVGGWDFNFGVGRGLTHASEGWVLKAVFSAPLQ